MSGAKTVKPLDIEIGYDLENEDHTLSNKETKETDQILQMMSDTLEKLNDHMDDNDKDKSNDMPETPRSTTS